VTSTITIKQTELVSFKNFQAYMVSLENSAKEDFFPQGRINISFYIVFSKKEMSREHLPISFLRSVLS
jgi:hypothetical protein